MSAIKNGIGSYTTKAGEKRYRVVIRVNGRIVRESGFTTKAVAEHRRDVLRADMRKGDWIDPAQGRIRFGDFAEDWVSTADIKPSTRALYEHLLSHQLSHWADRQLSSITLTDVRRWDAKLRNTPGVTTHRLPSDAWVAKSLRLFRKICQAAVEEGKLLRSPCEHFKIKADKAPDNYCPSPAEVIMLADCVPPEYRALVLVAGLGGLRWGEAIALTRRHVDVPNRCVHIKQIIVETVDHQIYVQAEGKTGKALRPVRLPQIAVDALAHHLHTYAEPGPDGLLFTASRSAEGARPYLRRSNFHKRVWRPAVAASGLPRVRFHDLRHAGATLFAQTGATTRELMDHVGHSTPGAAMRYQHASAARMEALASRLDELVPSDLAATGTDNVVPIRTER